MSQFDLESVIGAVIKAEGKNAESPDFFKDRRALDRRRGHVECLIPRAQCRRANRRRSSMREFSSQPWWLQIEYAVEKPLSASRSQLLGVK